MRSLTIGVPMPERLQIVIQMGVYVVANEEPAHGEQAHYSGETRRQRRYGQ